MLNASDTGSLGGVAADFATMEHDNEIVLGERHGWADSRPFGISAPDQRQHLYVVGKTGSGKTTLLDNMLAQHISAGHGVALIDPHGDWAEAALHHVPSWRADDLCYFNPGDLEHPVGFNILADVPQDERHLIASAVVSAFKSIWGRTSWGPRLEYILYNAVAALLECENVTLLGINRLLTEDNYRAWVIRQINDPFIRAFWEEEYAGYDQRFRREAIAPIQNKVGQLVLNPVIRNILGQVRSRVSIPFIMRNKRIFIANLSKGKLGHDKADLLGALLTSLFQHAAMARVNDQVSDRPDFHLFVDEFQNITNDAFMSILSEARKYHFCLVLSHQYLDQLSEEIRSAVFGNVGTIISFRVGYKDAGELWKEFGETIPPTILSDLERYETVVKLLVNGTNETPFRARTLPPVLKTNLRTQKLIALSRERFGTPRKAIEDQLGRWMKNRW